MIYVPAPSQPPNKVVWNALNSKIILNWEHVKALDNESEVTGYKVSATSENLKPNSETNRRTRRG